MSNPLLPNLLKQNKQPNKATKIPTRTGFQQQQQQKDVPKTVATFLYDSGQQDIGNKIDKTGWIKHLKTSSLQALAAEEALLVKHLGFWKTQKKAAKSSSGIKVWPTSRVTEVAGPQLTAEVE